MAESGFMTYRFHGARTAVPLTASALRTQYQTRRSAVDSAVALLDALRAQAIEAGLADVVRELDEEAAASRQTN
jgi:hypothetical protein